MSSIMAEPATGQDVRPLAHVLANTDPELWALALSGESWADMVARREAGHDILDDLLAEADDARPEPCTFCGGDGDDGAGHPCPLCGGAR